MLMPSCLRSWRWQTNRARKYGRYPSGETAKYFPQSHNLWIHTNRHTELPTKWPCVPEECRRQFAHFPSWRPLFQRYWSLTCWTRRNDKRTVYCAKLQPGRYRGNLIYYGYDPYLQGGHNIPQSSEDITRCGHSHEASAKAIPLDYCFVHHPRWPGFEEERACADVAHIYGFLPDGPGGRTLFHAGRFSTF